MSYYLNKACYLAVGYVCSRLGSPREDDSALKNIIGGVVHGALGYLMANKMDPNYQHPWIWAGTYIFFTGSYVVQSIAMLSLQNQKKKESHLIPQEIPFLQEPSKSNQNSSSDPKDAISLSRSNPLGEDPADEDKVLGTNLVKREASHKQADPLPGNGKIITALPVPETLSEENQILKEVQELMLISNEKIGIEYLKLHLLDWKKVSIISRRQILADIAKKGFISMFEMIMNREGNLLEEEQIFNGDSFLEITPQVAIDFLRSFKSCDEVIILDYIQSISDSWKSIDLDVRKNFLTLAASFGFREIVKQMKRMEASLPEDRRIPKKIWEDTCKNNSCKL